MFNRYLFCALLTLTLVLLQHINAIAQSRDRSKTIGEIAKLRERLNEKEKLFLSPSAEDRLLMQSFSSNRILA
jgi:hypothetical protein